MPSTLKADKVKKGRLSFHCKKHRIIALCKNKQKYSVQKTVSNSLKDGIFVTPNDELMELIARFAAKFKVSSNIRTMTWKRTKNRKILTSENEVQDASNFSQDNTKDFIQHGDVSQIFLSSKLKIIKTTNHLNIAQRKNTSMKDKRKDNSTLLTSTDNELKTKNHLIINQVGYMYRKFVLLLTNILLFLLIQIFCIIYVIV